MFVYLISYDLNKEHKDYSKIINAINLIDRNCYHVLKSQWLVYSDKSARDINDFLERAIDKDDDLLITQITNNYSGYIKNSTTVHEWIKSRINR